MKLIYYVSGVIFIIFLILVERRCRTILMGNYNRNIPVNYFKNKKNELKKVFKKNRKELNKLFQSKKNYIN